MSSAEDGNIVAAVTGAIHTCAYNGKFPVYI